MTPKWSFSILWISLLAGCGAFVVTLPFIPPGGPDSGVPDLGASDLGVPDLAAVATDDLASPGDFAALDLAAVDAGPDLAGVDLSVRVFIDIQFCWGGIPGGGFANCPFDTIEVFADGTFGGNGGAGQWALLMNGAELYMDVNNSTVSYLGVRVMDGCYEGTMGNNLPVGPKGTFRACFR